MVYDRTLFHNLIHVVDLGIRFLLLYLLFVEEKVSRQRHTRKCEREQKLVKGTGSYFGVG